MSEIKQVDSVRSDALYDSAYCAGLQQGFSFGQTDDNDGFRKALEARQGYLTVLRSKPVGTEHEPGPWEVNDQRASGWMNNAMYISCAYSGRILARVYNDGGDEESIARLIAAAPELLEELESLYTWLGDYTHEWPGRSKPEGQARLIRMRDLIAKATGRSEQDVQDDYGTRASIARATGSLT